MKIDIFLVKNHFIEYLKFNNLPKYLINIFYK